MPKLEYFIVAQSVSLDRDTNHISIFNVLEEFKSGGYPAVCPELVAVSAWNVEEDDAGTDYQVILRIQMPGDAEVESSHLNTRMNPRRHRVIHRMKNLPVTGPGEIVFEILLNGEHKASHRVTVLLHEGEAATTD